MTDKRIMDENELMINYAEMTSFDFGTLSADEMQTLNKITNNEYVRKPYAFKYGNFKLSDFFHELMTNKDE